MKAIRGLCVAPARRALDPLFRDSTVIVARNLGFSVARFNPAVQDLLPGGPGEVDPAAWQTLDTQVQLCKTTELDILLTLARPPADGGWQSYVDGLSGQWVWDSADYGGVRDLYMSIIDRVVTENGISSSRLHVEIANEASLYQQGGVLGITGDSTGIIQADYLASLSDLLPEMKHKFPSVRFLSHAFAFPNPALITTMANPWFTEVDAGFGATPPPLLTECDALNVHIYFTYTRFRTILTWDEYARLVYQFFDQFVQQLDSMPSPDWDVVKAKPIWITETGVSLNYAGMNGAKFAWGNEQELALFRAAAFDALANHPRCEAVFCYTARNEEPTWDVRGNGGPGVQNFNTGLLRYDGTVTASYEVMGNCNGIQNPAPPMHFEPAADFTFSVY